MKKPLKWIQSVGLILAIAAGVLRAADDLPDGQGKQEVEKACGSCHGVDLFTGQKHTAAEWRTVVDTMVGYGAVLDEKQIDVVVAYLTKNFGR